MDENHYERITEENSYVNTINEQSDRNEDEQIKQNIDKDENGDAAKGN